LRYTTRALTRPEGSEAVDSVHVSGWAMVMAGERGAVAWLVAVVAGESVPEAVWNQLWNCAIGSDGWRSDRRRPPSGSCLTNCPVGPGPGDGDGATGGFGLALVRGFWWRGDFSGSGQCHGK